jgi:hypothetical protein
MGSSYMYIMSYIHVQMYDDHHLISSLLYEDIQQFALYDPYTG